MKTHFLATAACGLALSLAAALPANATTTFATYNPVGTSANMSLTGLTLSAASPVIFDYKTPILSTFGDLAATLTLTATETGATAFGPLSLATFDGSFSLIYTGATKTMGGVTIDAGDNLLSGTFLGSVFTGYGSTGGLIDSVIGGGLVSYSSDFLTFDSGTDQGLSIGFTSIKPTVSVVGGHLTDFSGVTQGEFAADVTSEGGGGVPEPATWALMLLGVGAVGFALRGRARTARAVA